MRERRLNINVIECLTICIEDTMSSSYHLCGSGFLLLLVLIASSLFYYQYGWTPSPRIRAPQQSKSSSAKLVPVATIVVGYFPFSKAKHSKSEYLSWLENLLGYCQSPMIIFTNAEYQPILYRLRRNGTLPSLFITEYQSPSDMPPIQSLVSTFKQQHTKDPERAYHSVDLYAAWCAKSFMLDRGAQMNPFRSQYFLYMDAGAFRSSMYHFERWPHPPTVHAILNDQRLLLGMIAPLPRRFCPLKYQIRDGPIGMDLVEGTFMGGSASAIRWWTSTFYEVVGKFRAKKFFIGKDQSVMNAIALAYPKKLNMMLPFRTSCGDVWFAFGPLLANEEERQALAYPPACQETNTSHVVIPFELVCEDPKNLVSLFSKLMRKLV